MEITVITKGAERALDAAQTAIKKSDARAVREAARFALKPLKKNLSFSGATAPVGQLGKRSGRLFRQVKVKYFNRRDGMLGAAIKVKGDRSFVARFHEHGTKSHGRGGGPLIARQVFARTWKAIEQATATLYAQSFERNFRIQTLGF